MSRQSFCLPNSSTARVIPQYSNCPEILQRGVNHANARATQRQREPSKEAPSEAPIRNHSMPFPMP